MLSNKKIVCPNNLINVAKKKGTIDAVIVNAGEIFPMESVHKAVQHNLINPIFIGNGADLRDRDFLSRYSVISKDIANQRHVESRGNRNSGF